MATALAEGGAGVGAGAVAGSASAAPVGGLSVNVVGERNARGIPSMVFIVRRVGGGGFEE
jgi:hypothetical protein